VKSSKSKGKDSARHKKFEDQHPAVSPGLAGALVVPLLKGGERTRDSKGVLDAMRKDMGESEGNKNAVRLRGG
jgi:hypothetical protein